MSNRISPWAWIPTLYFAEGIPYFIVNVISVTMFKRLGMPNGELALYTSLLYLPWVIKPVWSPVVDILKTKRWWILATQFLMTAGFAALALSVSPTVFGWSLVIFYVLAFASATHDIAADGFYLLALDEKRKSIFVGIRSTFYRLSSVFGQGVVVVIAGLLETRLGNIPAAWRLTLLGCSLIFLLLSLWHFRFLPLAEHSTENEKAEMSKSRNGDTPEATYAPMNRSEGVSSVTAEVPEATFAPMKRSAEGNDGDAPETTYAPMKRSEGAFSGMTEASGMNGGFWKNFANVWVTFFSKPGVWTAILFMLMYRLPEAFSVKMLSPFLLDPVEDGGLGLSTTQSGLVYGTVGVIALTLGGILGGLFGAKFGLKRSMAPMAAALALPCAVYLYLAAAQPSALWTVYACVAVDQLGYGFGFTAYMLYMMHFSEGEFKTSHYAICTAFMALSMMLPGLVSGFLEEALGYVGFFTMVMICCIATFFAVLLARRRLS